MKKKSSKSSSTPYFIKYNNSSTDEVWSVISWHCNFWWEFQKLSGLTQLAEEGG